MVQQESVLNAQNLISQLFVTSRDIFLWLGGLPEFTQLVSYSIVAYLYSFKCLKAMLFGYLHELGTGGYI